MFPFAEEVPCSVESSMLEGPSQELLLEFLSVATHLETQEGVTQSVSEKLFQSQLDALLPMLLSLSETLVERTLEVD